MANVGRTRRDGEKTLTNNPIVKEFVPSSGWTEDSNGHYLLVDLPDFKKEQVKLQVDSSGNITVSGEMLTSDNRYIMRFEQMFPLPPNSDMDKVSGKFDGELLYVTVPKRAKEESTEQPSLSASASGENEQQILHRNDDIPENVVEESNDHQMREGDDDRACQKDNKETNNKSEKDSSVDSFGEDFLRKWGNEPSHPFERGMKILRRNKGIIITAVLAFSLGVLLSRKFGSADHIDSD